MRQNSKASKLFYPERGWIETGHFGSTSGNDNALGSIFLLVYYSNEFQTKSFSTYVDAPMALNGKFEGKPDRSEQRETLAGSLNSLLYKIDNKCDVFGQYH